MLIVTAWPAYAQNICAFGDTDCMGARNHLYGGSQAPRDTQAAQRYEYRQNALPDYSGSVSPYGAYHTTPHGSFQQDDDD